jgi:flagellar hook protein FlgE
MSQSLLTGASGLLAHQKKLDVVANNLANLNTTGYKSQRILFSDLVYSTISGGSGGSGDTIGGTNPQQIGFGVNIAQTGRNFNQGVLSGTGSSLDFAIEGDGFFAVSNGTTSYTRAGAFSLDEAGFLVDPGTGAYVQRYGSVGEGLDGSPTFQAAGNTGIQVPLGASIAGRKTDAIDITGNLPATFTLPQKAVLSVTRPFEVSDLPASTSTLLNDLDSNATDYTTGDELLVQGTQIDGVPFSSTLAVDNTTTLADIVDHYNSFLYGAVASLDAATGNIQIKADSAGPVELLVNMTDDPSNTGDSDFSSHAFVATTVGKDGDKAETTMQVYDVRGEAHTVKVTFEKKDDNIWETQFDLIDGSGTLTDSVIEQIEFNENGRFQAVRGIANGDSDFTIQFNSLTDPQTVAINLDSLTHMATSYSTSFRGDGYPPGSITDVAASADGTLEGVATNGQRIPIAQLAIANFINVNGLKATGQNYYVASANSGNAQIGPGASGAAGFVRGGQLEASNVDVALEFTQMIVAQRGFSANARTITVASEVLQELTNIIR